MSPGISLYIPLNLFFLNNNKFCNNKIHIFPILSITVFVIRGFVIDIYIIAVFLPLFGRNALFSV